MIVGNVICLMVERLAVVTRLWVRFGCVVTAIGLHLNIKGVSNYVARV